MSLSQVANQVRRPLLSAMLPVSLGIIFFAGAMAKAEVQLLPKPREMRLTGQGEMPGRVEVKIPGGDAEDQFAGKSLTDDLASAAGKAVYAVTLLRSDSAGARKVLTEEKLSFSPEMNAEGYALVLRPKQGYVIGATSAGVFYGVQTLRQLLSPANAENGLPLGTVRDWPAMKYRGVDDDLSRGPVPTLAFQEHQIEVIASFKMNVYSPYLEHTLAYDKAPMAAQRGGALTRAEVRELVAFAKPYHVTIVPEQEAFGHLHHVLKYELYKDVAETERGFVLAPGQPGTMPLIHDWFLRRSPKIFLRPSSISAPTKPLTLARAGLREKCKSMAWVQRTSSSSRISTKSWLRCIAASCSGETSAAAIRLPLQACLRT